MSAETIINTAKFAWELIKDNQPTAEIGDSTANAVPQVDDWQALTGGSQVNAYRMYYNAPYLYPFDGYDHVQIKILLKWQIGARYRGGGAFIPNLWIEVPECYVGLGWHANIGFTARNPTNANAQEPGRPIAQIPVTVKGTVSSVAELYHLEWSFMLLGDGTSTTS